MEMGPHPFTLRQLQYVVAVADALSFRRAAERCHVSQPSLSAQLAQVEAALGVTLFERDRRRVLPTEAGKLLIARARRLLLDADDLVEAARRAADPLTGTLRLGIIPTVAPYLLPSVAPALREAFPRLTVAWLEDRTASLVERLEAGRLDAAVVALEAELGEVEYATIADDPFVLATAAGAPLGTAAGAARASELADADVLLLDDGHCLRDQALRFCASASARELEFRATSLATLTQMVAGGAGVTLLPRLAVATEASRAALAIRPFAAPTPSRRIVLAWRPGAPIAAALQPIAEVLRAAFPREPAPPGPRDPRRGTARRR